ncbi:MAG: hypothetical protein R6X25_15585 [Candidatus Krumholzibacteriia bacterium]
MRDRMVQTCLLAAVVIVVVGLIGPTPRDPYRAARPAESSFYIHKVHTAGSYDVVVLGDSRTLNAVAPAELAAVLGDIRVFNFAYQSGGLNPEIYAAGERRLDPDSPRPTMVLGVSPLTLLAERANNTQYRLHRDKPRDEVLLKQHFPEVAQFFAPIEPGDIIGRLFNLRPKVMYYQEFHDDGWIAARLVPPDTARAMEPLAADLAGMKIDDQLVAALVAQTHQWHREGITVFAFRPPAQSWAKALEDSLLGFDEAALARAVQSAGGIWLEFSPAAYPTYDGSHLDHESARKFSRDLASKMARYYANRPEAISATAAPAAAPQLRR